MILKTIDNLITELNLNRTAKQKAKSNYHTLRPSIIKTLELSRRAGKQAFQNKQANLKLADNVPIESLKPKMIENANTRLKVDLQNRKDIREQAKDLYNHML